ncbi:RING finger protein nhl-1, partial [Geodia barretti]
DNQVYVCDHYNHRIQVFDLDLNFVRSIGSRGKGRGELDAPDDVKFDTAGNMYVAEWDNERVQVMDTSGQFIRVFGQEGEGKLRAPSGLHIVNKYVYVSELSGHCIVVYETSGQFVTSFGRYGKEEGEFRDPFCITSCVDGFIHVCDFVNKRVRY